MQYSVMQKKPKLPFNVIKNKTYFISDLQKSISDCWEDMVLVSDKIFQMFVTAD